MIILVLICITGLYLPGIYGPFLFDDYGNLVTNPLIKESRLDGQAIYEASLTGTAGPTGRPVSMLSFALNSAWFGFTPLSFKAVNLLIHLATTLIIFLFVYQLSAVANKDNKDNFLLALTISTIWSIHPIQVSTVLYVVQRMTELAAFFTTASLVLYIWARRRYTGTLREALLCGTSLFVLAPLALLSKENGALTPLYILLTEWLLLRNRFHRNPWTTRLLAFIAAVFTLASVIYLAYYFDLDEAYANRPFTLGERLLTEVRVIWHYIGWLLLPSTSTLGLYHDDIDISKGLLSPPSTIIAIAFLTAVMTIAYLTRKKNIFFLFGIMLFLFGHSVESSVLPLEIAFEHRNYFPSLGLFIAIGFPLARIIQSTTRHSLAGIMSVILIITLGFATFSRVISWSSEERFYITEVTHHPNSARANYEFGNYLASKLESDPEQFMFLYPLAMMHLDKAYSLDKDYKAAKVRALPIVYQYDNENFNEWHEETKKALSAGILPNQTVTILGWISICDKKRCPLPERYTEELFEAVFSNPSLRGIARSLISSYASQFYVNRMKDIMNGFFYLHEAQESSPKEPIYHIYEAKLCKLLNNMECIEKALREASKLDRLNKFDSKIRRLINTNDLRAN